MKYSVIKHSPVKISWMVLLALLAGCSTTSQYDSSPYTSRKPGGAVPAAATVPMTTSAKRELSYHAGVAQTLYQQYEEWQGVPYRWGGMSRNGVDCSAFVYLTYAAKFDVRLPRTTENQAAVGAPLPKHQLRAGDLVFFKTSHKNRHVGMYVEGGKFLHVSEKEGVKLSDLDNVYWNKHYWMARRLQ